MISILLSLTSVSANIRDCGKETTLFRITELSQSPTDSIRAGENMSLTLHYEVPQEIPKGTSETSVTLNFIPLGTTTEDLCEKMACPIYPGSYDGSTWASFPSGVSGTLVSKINWYDEKKNHLLCIESVIKASSSLRQPVKSNILEEIVKLSTQ
jgi:hypothetical protein